uniref:Uncharacterized protein n=1 Tax=viral metagenome TaxID=1070528 RepID=A0A6M3K7N3_9ZZZZ
MPVTGAPALDTPIPQFYTNALQMRQQQHELQMRVGLQLAQLKQRDLQFQAQEDRLKDVASKQYQLNMRSQMLQVNRDAAAREDQNFIKQKTLASMNQEEYENPEYKTEVVDWEAGVRKKLLADGVDEGDDAWFKFQAELAEKRARHSPTRLRYREGVVPPNATPQNLGNVGEAAKAGGYWGATFGPIVEKYPEYKDVPLVWAQRAGAPVHIVPDPVRWKEVTDQIEAKINRAHELEKIDKKEGAGGQTWQKRMDDRASWVKDLTTKLIQGNPDLGIEDAVDKAAGLYDKITVDPVYTKENARVVLKDIDDKKTQFQKRLIEQGDNLSPQQQEDARTIIEAFDTYEMMIQQLGPYNDKTWPSQPRLLYARVMKILNPLFEQKKQGQTTGGPPSPADVAEAQTSGLTTVFGSTQRGDAATPGDGSTEGVGFLSSPTFPTGMSGGMSGEVANPIPGFFEILSRINLGKAIRKSLSDPTLKATRGVRGAIEDMKHRSDHLRK